ncbi:MAG: formylglycine-generating enzyme family protein [Candidatus Accumulibacter sp.]|jgi:formylglycine-generating enzyme required for sulfatase activity|nr:formylglycine-generating enzyme family protein [Accumulibacter sp.]
MKRFVAVFLFLSLSLALSGSAFSAQTAGRAYTNSIGMEFVLIPDGSFTMGANKNLEEAYDNEMPPHRVHISRPFYLGKHEVTQAQWMAVMDDNPSEFKGRDNPVENVSWNDAQEFIRRLNAKEGTDKYRLPTEAEWEYAARAGTTTRYSFGDDTSNIDRHAWYRGNSGDRTHPVGQKEPNPRGLYDMHGNVWEWVQDWYGEDYYAQSPASDPRGPVEGTHRVLRGGGWSSIARSLRSADRGRNPPELRIENRGFRLAFSPSRP